VDAVIATNTTTMRNGVEGMAHAAESGGLSGAPVAPLSTRITEQLVRALRGEIPVIGVGGIMSGVDARARMATGARLVQIYTGLIYRGPSLARECVTAACESPQ
jgi:dihydroorotate dehydrogenase